MGKMPFQPGRQGAADLRWLAFRTEMLAALLGGVSLTAANVLTFQEGADGYTGTLDTTVHSAAPDLPLGDYPIVEVTTRAFYQGSYGKEFGLLKFENIFGPGPQQIPPGSRINSVHLRL